MIEVKTNTGINIKVQDLDGEVWKDIVGYEGLYCISNYGRVKSLAKTYENFVLKKNVFVPEMIMKTCFVCGYPTLRLSKNKSKKQWQIHRLLGLHFMPNPNNYPCINHINSDRADFTLPNLEWCTYSQNSLHMFRVNGYKQKSGKDDELSKPFIAKNKNGIEITFYSQREAAKILGTYQANIFQAIHNKKAHKGYTFEFLNK